MAELISVIETLNLSILKCFRFSTLTVAVMETTCTTYSRHVSCPFYWLNMSGCGNLLQGSSAEYM